MSKLKLILLGQFECLLSSGERISLAMRKAEVLLAYLALMPGIRHPRERLINLLWSDRGEEQARNSLRQCLSAIKKSLGESADLVLQIDRTTVSLKPGLIDVDAHEFEQLALEGDFESLSTAAGLYRGEFLEGISIRDAASQDWLDGERARFKRQFVEILINLGETQLASHDYGAAIRSTERLVEQDPLGEIGWRLLMRSYAESGDRSHALQAYKRCEKAIRDELDVEPEAATVELRDQIANGSGKAAQKAAISALAEDTPTSPGIANTTSDPESSTDHSIAVLPFDNLSGDPEQEYFSDGITDSIILNLSLFPGLNVKSRNTSFAFKQQMKSPGEISQELKVDYIVEGSVRKSQHRIRITVQLIEAGSGNQVWGNRYDSEIEDLFELEENLSRTIAATVTGQIESDLRRIAIAKGAAEQQAYDLLLSGIYHTYRFNRQDTAVAIEKLNQCLAQDPDNLRAHVMLYGCHSMGYLERWTEDHQASFRLAEKHIRKALKSGPESGMVQVVFGEFLIFKGDLEEADLHLDKALELNPNDPDALITKALKLELQGQFSEALELAERVIALDPYHPWAEWELAVSQFYCGHYETALETLTKSRTSPGFMQVYIVMSHIKLGNIELARQALQKFLQTCRENMLSMPQTLDEWLAYTQANYHYVDPLINQDIIDCLVQAGLEDSPSPDRVSPPDAHSIAVLPFDNLSGDPGQEYFSDGITESIILNLSLFPGLHVKSRNSSFAFKQQLKSIGEISEELEVDYIVEGSIRKTATRVRVTVQLVEATSGNQVWGKRYDAEIEDLFDLEEDLSRTIAATVTGQIESDLQRISITRGASDLQAYDLLLNGTYHLDLADRKSVETAIKEFKQCLLKDPDNAVAHAQLFYCYDLIVLDHWTEDVEDARELATEHLLKAVSLRPDLPFVQVAYADHLMFFQQFDEAEHQLKLALDANPNDTEAIAYRAVMLSLQGQAEPALEQAELSLRLDPYHPWAKWIKSESLFFCDRYADCIENIADTDNAPAFIQIYAISSYIRQGKLDEAKTALKNFLGFCQENMLSMPDTVEGWYDYFRINAPFTDPAKNRGVIDNLVQAGLEGELASTHRYDDSAHQPGILVLPFSNLSGDPEQEYFSNGITESIIQSLGSFNELNVKSRHTSFAFKDSSLSTAEIAAEVGIGYIVDGSVRKRGEQIRVAVQLSETASGNQVWGKRFDTPIEDIFAIEEEMVLTIAATIFGKIDRDIRTSSFRKPDRDLTSHDYMMRSTYHLERFTPEDILAAAELAQKSIASDPNNVDAHIALTAASNVSLFENWVDDREKAMHSSHRHIARALEIEPDNAMAHAFMSEQYMFEGDLKKAMFHADRAIELNPAQPDGLSYKAYLLAAFGEIEAAIKQADRCMQIDPYHYYMGWNAGQVYRMVGQYERAIEAFRSIPVMPASLLAETAACQAGLGNIDEARATMSEYHRLAREQMPNYPRSVDAWRKLWFENAPTDTDELFDEFFDLLLKAGLCDQITEDSDQIPSVLVLPLENMSGDPEQQYFSKGMTESIILALSSSSGLSVKSSHTSFAYQNSTLSISAIGDDVGVSYIVEGSIRKHRDQVRITVQLSESSSGNQIWGKRYDKPLDELFDLEEELVHSVAGAISGRIGMDIKIEAAHKSTRDMKSYDYLMRGWYYGEQLTLESLVKALENFQKCADIDPQNGEAHALLGTITDNLVFENWCEDREATLSKSNQYFSRALELDPNSSVVHAFTAFHCLLRKDPKQGLVHANRAIELEPTLSDGYSARANAMIAMGNFEEAVRYADLALEIDPYNKYVGYDVGEVYRWAGAYEKSIEVCRSIPQTPPSMQGHIATNQVALGNMDEARKEMSDYLEAAAKMMPRPPTSIDEWRAYWKLTSIYPSDKSFDIFFDQLLKAGLCDNLENQLESAPSIAVLPFENMSGDPEQEYFSDGITASIILSLGLFRGLTVKSQNSSFSFRNSGKSSEEIADKLKVTYLVEGSIRKSADKVRISVQLIESLSGNQLWGKQYDAELEDILALEQEMSRTIAATISGRIDHTLQQSAVSSTAKNLQSYDYLLRGLYYFGKFTASDFEKARQEIEKCLAIDPENATAHTNLGMIHWVEILEGWTEDQDNSERLTRLHLEKAIDIDPGNALACSYFGEYLFFKKDYKQSEFHIDKAIELNPTASEGYVVKADLLGMTRRIDEAIPYADKALQLDPHSIGAGWAAGGVYQGAGQFDRAIRTYRSISHPPPSIHASIAACFIGLGLEEEARMEMKRYQELARRDMPTYPRDKTAWQKLWRTNLPFQYDEDFDAAFEILVEAGLLEDLNNNREEIPSIAVLPFENMSGDSEQEHFSDGITTDIIATLARFEHMRTVSRYSVLQYKGQHVSIPDIAQQQNVRYILEGSVRKAANRIRVSAELIDSESEKICWSEQYDRNLDDLFAVQDEITRNIALAMKVQLDDGNMAIHRSAGTSNIKAWQLTMQATDLQDTYIRENILAARDMLQEAIKLDPDYPYAWVTLGWTHWQEIYSGWDESFDTSLTEAEKANQQALQLAPEYSEALSLAGFIHLMKNEPDEALAACGKAVQLEPGNAENNALMAVCLMFVGDYDNAREYERKMHQLCPVLPNWYHLVGGQIARLEGDYETAAHNYQLGVDVEPDSPLCRFYLVDVLMEMGNEPRARELAQEIRELDKEVKGRGLVYILTQDKSTRKRFRSNLEKLDLY